MQDSEELYSSDDSVTTSKMSLNIPSINRNLWNSCNVTFFICCLALCWLSISINIPLHHVVSMRRSMTISNVVRKLWAFLFSGIVMKDSNLQYYKKYRNWDSVHWKCLDLVLYLCSEVLGLLLQLSVFRHSTVQVVLMTDRGKYHFWCGFLTFCLTFQVIHILKERTC